MKKTTSSVKNQVKIKSTSKTQVKSTALAKQDAKSTSTKLSAEQKTAIFPNLTNQDSLKRTLKLLGVIDQQFQKQTKVVFAGQLFPKILGNPTNSKQFFYICQICMKYLASSEQFGQLQMWYPPRSVNEQIQYKKTLFKLLQKMQAQTILPKNIILSKMVIMGEAQTSSLLQFLRILSELSLRALYIQKYSKQQRLIQIAINNPIGSAQNDINKFYIFPFNQSITNVQPPIKSQTEIQSLKQIYKIYISRYRKKILQLRAAEQTQGINPQQLMSQILEQKQLAQTLSNKVSKSIYSQNRAFDRRIIMDKNAQIWKELGKIQCNFIEEGESSVLRIQGETSKILNNWKTASGTTTLIQFNNQCDKIQTLKKKCQQRIQQLSELRSKILTMIK